jgi:hypothetical protein
MNLQPPSFANARVLSDDAVKEIRTFLFELIIAFDEGYDDQLRCFEEEFFERHEQQPDLFDDIEKFEEFEDEIPF